jgi:ABC-type maltose transport system permease subunit
MSSATLTGRIGKPSGSIKRNRRMALVFRIILAIVMLIFALFPVVWIFSASINPTGSLAGQPLIPQNPTLDNYRYLFTSRQHPFETWFWNSLKLATLTTFIGLAITTLAAYAFSRFRFGGRRQVLQGVLLVQVFPNFLNMVALFIILTQLGNIVPAIGLNTHTGLLLLYLGSTLGANTWLTKGYFDSIPRDLDEAATVDGASQFETFWYVILPLVRPILVVVGLLTFIGTYSEYVLARIVLTSNTQYTMAVGLNIFIQDQYGQRWGIFSAGALMAAVPVVIIFLVFQRYLVGGLTSGAVKG